MFFCGAGIRSDSTVLDFAVREVYCVAETFLIVASF